MRGVEGGAGGCPKTAILHLEERENRNIAYPNTENAVTNGIKLALSRLQGPVVQKLDSAIHWINHYPADKF